MNEDKQMSHKGYQRDDVLRTKINKCHTKDTDEMTCYERR